MDDIGVSIGVALTRTFMADLALTDDQIATVNDILDAATDWAADRMPLGTFAMIGGLPSPATGAMVPAYGRCVAVMAAARTDPRRSALLDAVDALVAQEARDGFHRETTHGPVSRAEQFSYDAWVRNGQRRPIRPATS